MIQTHLRRNEPAGPLTISGVAAARELGIEYKDLVKLVDESWLPDWRVPGIDAQYRFCAEDLTVFRARQKQALVEESEDHLIYMQEAAAILGIDPSRMRDLIKDGTLPDHSQEHKGIYCWIYPELQEARKKLFSSQPSAHPERKDSMNTTATTVRYPAAYINPKYAEHWIRPSGRIYDLDGASAFLKSKGYGGAVATLRGLTTPSAGPELPQRKNENNELVFYESDLILYTQHHEGRRKKGSEDIPAPLSPSVAPTPRPIPVFPVLTPEPTPIAAPVQETELPSKRLPPEVAAAQGIFAHMFEMGISVIEVKRLTVKIVTVPVIVVDIPFKIVPDIYFFEVWGLDCEEQPRAFQVGFSEGVYYVKNRAPELEPEEINTTDPNLTPEE